MKELFNGGFVDAKTNQNVFHAPILFPNEIFKLANCNDGGPILAAIIRSQLFKLRNLARLLPDEPV